MTAVADRVVHVIRESSRNDFPTIELLEGDVVLSADRSVENGFSGLYYHLTLIVSSVKDAGDD